MTNRIDADWLLSPDVQHLFRCFQTQGYELYAVGGCVRNALLSQPITDIDLSTNARPADVMALLDQNGIKAVPTGIDHGTITAVINTVPYEITTYRKDVETDGRRAVVAFADTIEQDSLRRDFTINAIYADATGRIYDPQNGLADIHPTQIRFIGNANQRIAEDYLRILRFFRFFAQYGDPTAGLDADGLAACASGADGLDHISKERIGAEVLKLFAAPDPSMAVAAMGQSGVLHRVLPGADSAVIAVLVHLENTAPCALRRLAALGGVDVADNLRLSKTDAKTVNLIRSAALEGAGPKALGYQLGEKLAYDAILVRHAMLGQDINENIGADITIGAAAKFPLKACDLPEYTGANLGKALKFAQSYWIEHDFLPTKPDLLGYVEHNIAKQP